MRKYNATTNRRDSLTCKYGCCQLDKGMDKPECNRRAKKAARQEGKREIDEMLESIDFG